ETGLWWVSLSTGSAFLPAQAWAAWALAQPGTLDWADFEVGDFNGDGLADMALRDQETGQWWLNQSLGYTFAVVPGATWDARVVWEDPQVGDFNGDGKDDLAGR